MNYRITQLFNELLNQPVPVFCRIYFKHKKIRENIPGHTKYNIVIITSHPFLHNLLFLLTRLSHKMPVLPSYRNQSIDLHSKSIEWFLYEGNTGI